VAAPLDPHPAPLTAADVRHLLRRTGFGALPNRVQALTGMTAVAAARYLLEEAATATLPNPDWYGTPITSGTAQATTFNTERERILQRMVNFPLRERMSLFWHNHFPVEAVVVNFQANVVLNGTTTTVYYTPALMWSYYRLMRDNALGSLRTLVEAMGKEPAMLRYLNGNQSTAASPNQNYARELLELFSMGIYDVGGQANYTDTNTHGNASDVVMAARALTGWRDRVRTVNGVNTYTVESYFTASRFDSGQKTFLGQTGNWDHDATVRIIFEQRGPQVARFLARKLLAFFVTPVPDAAAEAALGGAIVAANFELRPVLETLLASQHFFAPGYRGSLVKSPTDLYLGLSVDLGARHFDPAFNWPTMRTYCMGNTQDPKRSHIYFQPPDVAGWPGHNPPSATGRPSYMAWYAADDFSNVWNWLRSIALNDRNRFPYDPAALAAALAPHASTPGRISDDPFAVARAVAEHLLAVPLAHASIPNRSATPFAGDIARNPIPQAVLDGPRYGQDLAKIMLAGAPWYEWPSIPDTATMGTSKATLLRNYVQTLVTEVPEFLLY
jgi:uncharacterized protein (DUF1800 family)